MTYPAFPWYRNGTPHEVKHVPLRCQVTNSSQRVMEPQFVWRNLITTFFALLFCCQGLADQVKSLYLCPPYVRKLHSRLITVPYTKHGTGSLVQSHGAFDKDTQATIVESGFLSTPSRCHASGPRAVVFTVLVCAAAPVIPPICLRCDL